MKDLTSITFLGVSQFTIASIFSGSIEAPSFEMAWPTILYLPLIEFTFTL